MGTNSKSKVDHKYAFIVTIEPKLSSDDPSAADVSDRLRAVIENDFQVDEDFGWRVTCRRVLSVDETEREAETASSFGVL